MIVALIDSGFGLLPTAAWLRRMRPDLDLMLSMDPECAPWGPKPADWVADHVVSIARRAVDRGADVVVLPCNTASVTALEHVRADLGDDVPVVGTVPAIKPAAAVCKSVAIWATAATTSSRYQADLIERFGNGSEVVGVACHGLADAIDRGDREGADRAIADAVARTPGDVEGIVLGCTHYPLVADSIVARFPEGVRLFDSAEAVARQTLRRLADLDAAEPGTREFDDRSGASGRVEVYLSGRRGALPPGAEAFAAGRELLAATTAT
ncbi:glutamate racemase [Rhodococcus coprophilus]|uniref:Glutamate racemase n=1 Tax=Rhodococcus coprophilus TaxID=38310 RepID=A0A2X4XLT8_9NOCA|nr:aspartate/glutamate racemase family protein [Rhodococcus coprophilus]MBM7459874.1 glutamate racemase [Rhodococcus coprophilus]SQI37604.1 glutamate racemase [Rhodococcus coprophilus]